MSDPSLRVPRRHASLVRRAAVAAAVGLVLAGCTDGGVEAPGIPAEPPPAPVGVQMFQWTWDAIAQECTDVLGPAGFDYVLTSPPQEHIVGEPWWTAYQPVSHRIESRLGTREEFAAMVTTCGEAGVGIVADAVINHMTGQSDGGVGWAGTTFEHYEYPGLYSDADGDFHHCGLAPEDDIASYSDRAQVQTCELLNLADLATGTDAVRDTIVAYLEDLLSLGVAGFRIDAAKHMAAEDVEAITARLPEGAVVWSEVIRGGGEPITPEEYLDAGDVFEFAYAESLAGIMRGGSLVRFEDLATGAGPDLLPPESAIVFVDNHDTERNGSTLGYPARERYALANVLMLAAPYGLPVVYSGFAFDALDGYDAGPPQGADGAVIDASCPAEVGPAVRPADGEWVCQHRWPQVLPMVAFRAAAGDAALSDWWSEGRAVAFGREDRAFVVVNAGPEPLAGTWSTSLVAGDYCDVQTGGLVDGACSGAVVSVAEDGSVSSTVPAQAALAIHAGARPGG